MKLGFSNKQDHDLHTQLNRFKDLRGNLDIMENARSSWIWLLTFSAVTESVDFIIFAENGFTREASSNYCKIEVFVDFLFSFYIVI